MTTAVIDFILGSPGIIFDFAGTNAPNGFLLCNGQAISRTTYAKLFAAITVPLTGNTTSGSNSVSSASMDITGMGLIGAKVEGAGIPSNTTITAATSSTLTLSANATATASAVSLTVIPWGNGDGSTTFTLPDLRGQVCAGKDDMGGTAASRLTTSGSGVTGTKLGATGGAETVTLTTAQMPVHTHANTVTDPGHTHSNTVANGTHTHGNTLSDPGHTHSHNANSANSSSSTGGGGFALPATSGATINAATTGITINNAAAASNVTITNASQVAGVTITNASQGSGNAHSNTQPTIVLNKIIKY